MKLIVGLGNPGNKYNGTRHNVGFEVIAELARRHVIGLPKSKFHGELAETNIKNQKSLLLCPLTYMNASGQSVREAVDFYKLSFEDLLIICDDLNLKTGRLRLKPSGSAGGQNGLKDIIRVLGGQSFPRLRIGIDRPPPKWETANYVLGKFDEEEKIVIQRAIDKAADAVESWIDSGIQIAMNKFNVDPDAKPKRPKQPKPIKRPNNRTEDQLNQEDQQKGQKTTTWIAERVEFNSEKTFSS